MSEVIVIAGAVIILFLLTIIVVISSRASSKRNQKKSVNQSSVYKNDDEVVYERTVALNSQRKENASFQKLPEIIEDNFHSIPKFSKEQREEIANQAKMGKVMGTEVLKMNEENGRVGETELLSANDDSDYYAVLNFKEENSEREFKMTSMVINVGRDPETSDFIIASDNYVGRSHAVIYFKQGRFYVTDLNSKNGTFINGERVLGVRELHDGCQIKFGNTDVTFKINI